MPHPKLLDAKRREAIDEDHTRREPHRRHLTQPVFYGQKLEGSSDENIQLGWLMMINDG